MLRRDFLSTTVAAGLGVVATANAQGLSATKESKADSSKPLFVGYPVVSGPAPESLSILQAINGPASGYLELAIGSGDFQRIDAEAIGLLPYEKEVLKFTLPPLPPNQEIRYRIVARKIEFTNAYKISQGEVETTEVKTFRTLNPAAESTRFIVWNDTHENQETIKILQGLTQEFRPDFMQWNGDQTNDIYDPEKMKAQYLAPSGLEISAQWPLAYARGNHDVRGPAARLLPKFTGTPDNRFYYAFRSGPVAALVMDTGEDKPDDREVFAGLAGFELMRARQREWLSKIIEEPWFKSAPYRILFCHIPLWWIDDGKKRDFWMFSEVSRDAWLPLLEKAGVQIVISGHTHNASWMPKSAQQPIGQLIGGGPRKEIATIIEGVADQKTLTLTCKSLDGKVLHEIKIPA